MTQVSRKGFRDKNGKQVVIVPPKEEYAGEVLFQDSDAIDTILSEGVHHISYKRDGKRHPTQHILVVTRDYGKLGPIAPTREIVLQLLIDNLGGMMKRYRKFTDTELLEPDGDWTEWVSMIPTIDIDSSITEDGYNPVTGAAIYAALAGKAKANHSHSAIMDGESNAIGIDGIQGEINIEVFDGENGGETAITPQNIGNLHRALQNPAAPVSGGNNLITNGQVFNALVIRDNNISNLQAQLNAISARVLALETPTWSETGVDVSSMRYDANCVSFADDAEAYGGYSIGDQVKVVVTLDGSASTIYTTVKEKRTGPYGVYFVDDIYPTVTSGQTLSVILYKRAS